MTIVKAVWPSDLNHMSEQSGWGFTPVTESARTDFDAGPARVRRRFTRSRAEIEMNLAMTYSEFELFKSFVDGDLLQASRWFSMPVFQGSTYRQYEVRFKDATNPYKAAHRGFNLVSVAFTLETRESTALFDTGITYLVGLWGEEASLDFCNRLKVLVNEEYPSIW